MAIDHTETIATPGRPGRRARDEDNVYRPGAAGPGGRPKEAEAGRRSALPEDLDPALFWRWVAKSLGKTSRPVVGWVLTGVGLLAIFLGWFGISGTALVAKQLPYLISGGVGGVALVAIGAVILGTEDMRKDSGRLDRLEKQVADLHSTLLARADAPDISLADQEVSQSSPSGGRRATRRRSGEAAPGGRHREEAGPGGRYTEEAGPGSHPREADDRDLYGPDAPDTLELVALPGATTFHRPDCAMVEGKAEAEPIADDVALGEGLKPCRLCDPLPPDA